MKQLKPLQKHALSESCPGKLNLSGSKTTKSKHCLPFLLMGNIPPLCSMFLLLTEWVDIWLGTDLNTKRFSKPRFQVSSNYPFAGCNSLQDRPTGGQNRGGSLQRKKKFHVFHLRRISWKMCFSPETWSCLSHSSAEYFPLASRLARRWRARAAKWAKSCPELTPDLREKLLRAPRCHLIVLSASHQTLALHLRYNRQDALTLPALQQHWQQNKFTIRAKSLICMPRSAPTTAFPRGNTVVKAGGLLVTLQPCLWGAHLERIRVSIGPTGLR